MIAVKPEWLNMEDQEVTFAKNQPEYLQLPARVSPTGRVTTKWKLSIGERIKLIFGGSVYLQILTFGDRLQPVKLSVGPPVA